MGLDVYLYRYENKAETDALEKKVGALTDAVWSGASSDDGRGPERLARAKEIELQHGYVEVGENYKYLEPPGKAQIKQPSAKYPEHFFKIGYFRSSYNAAGINRVLEEVCNTSLSEIMGYAGDYCFQPDWATARRMAVETLELLQKAEKVRVFKFEANPFCLQQNLPSSEAKALEIFLEQNARKREDGWGSYSNRDGYFYLDEPLNVKAVIPGMDASFRGPTPCVYVVAEAEWFDSYIQSMEIVIETIDFVLGQSDPEKYWLHWSG